MKKIFLLLILLPAFCLAQHHENNQVDDQYVRNLIEKYKKDRRGPYSGIRWFCKDGSINPPKEPCESGGVQHALLKEEVKKLAKDHHIFLGQILASTDYADFWDAENEHSRLKQYMVEKYLKTVDNGWVNRRAQFYRGAFQSEDETEWGKNFFAWLLAKPNVLKTDFYLVRQAVKDIPHAGDSNVSQLMRSQSKSIATAYPKFMDLRIKIHGQPARSDIQEVREFKEKNAANLSSSLKEDLDELVATMEEFFAPVDIEEIKALLSGMSNKQLQTQLGQELDKLKGASESEVIARASDAMMMIREQIDSESSPEGKLAMLDVSLKLESLLTTTITSYEPDTLEGLLDEVCYLGTAAAASGYTELWEWNRIEGGLSYDDSQDMTLARLNKVLLAARNQIEWGTSMNKAVFDNVITLYEGFEPMVHGFLDDRIRGSVALYLGNKAGKLGTFITDQAQLKNDVLDLSNQSQIHGLNPGYANGKLMVVEGELRNLDVDANSIYAFQRPPSDLRPVAGILNISQGNLVSHLQLLARNLGIPNTSISDNNLQELKKYSGQRVFYAVSNKGTVIVKPESEMTSEERALFAKETEEKRDEMIEVPVDRIKLDQTTILNLTEVDARSSGIVCGPKAANLGELKKNFPDRVVDGFVIPFGIFRAHLDQTIPGKQQTYWEFLRETFAEAENMRKSGAAATSVEQYQLGRFKTLSGLIEEMPLLASFEKDLEDSFRTILNKELGEQPVFLRSDTNMEDLASFTGAGINLTLFNIKERQAVIDGIKKVWASPYFDRSFRWRQKYLNNPENVYPSIVVIPGVNNDCSGVMITKGVSSGRSDEITVAMSRGVGGAVEGQIAETWSIDPGGKGTLISPSRELYYNSLDPDGGTSVKTTTLQDPIMDRTRRAKVKRFSRELIETMDSKGMEGPYDVELGFRDGKIWLFQVRPFVENKNALSSDYLESISPKIDENKKIPLTTSI